MNPSSSSSSHRRKTLPGGTSAKDATRKRIEQMEVEREERRKEMIQKKEAKKAESAKLLAAGNPGDVDFIGMVDEWRTQQEKEYKIQHKKKEPLPSALYNCNILVAVRKRPMSEKERQKKDHDSVSCYHPKVWIHSAKFKVDGITKYLTHTGFQFDHAFGENSSTDEIYLATTMPLVDHVLSTRGRATVFCYGQTGSGKTFTMSGIQQILAHDLYGELRDQKVEHDITLAFFELYGGYVQDLLHGRKRCKLLEDGRGEVNITGLQEVPAKTAADFLRIIEDGHSQRTTHTTEANDCSSRSHAICQVFLRDHSSGKLQGKLTLVDLAGSERGSDTKSHNSQRRTESADINTSLLSLKECIRALGQKNVHVPYRGSKLTLILKDCFSPDSKTTMIATVSPGASATDHSLNTLRYADRIKEQRISASSKKASRGSGIASNTLPHSSLTQKRLSRISAALCWDPNNMMDSEHGGENHSVGWQNKTLKNTGSVERCVVHDLVESVNTLSGDVSDLDDSILDGQEVSDSCDDKEAEPTQEDEAEMRRTVQALFDLEEALLNQHMINIQENAEMLGKEGKMLRNVQKEDATEEEMDNYAIQLAEYLDRKESLIWTLQSKLDEFQNHLSREAEIAQKVTRLTQY